MKIIDRFFQAQLDLLRHLAHLVYGRPAGDEDFRRDLADTERMESLTGTTTMRGDMLRFQAARRDLVAAIFRPRAS